MSAQGEHLDRVLDEARCVVCVGPGGVGKTSSSAAIAIEAARRGRRTIVLTIDPAKRLANALGLPEIGNEEADVPPEAFTSAGLAPPSGRLTAMMLDIKSAWDEVVKRYHPDAGQREKLLSNRLYVALSTALAGSQEYMAMEKLYDLSVRTEDRLELIVLDTPPANHAVDFLEAPSRMVNALDNDATRWLTEPYQQRGRLTQRLFDAGSSFFVRTISRFTGAELLDELAELLTCFQGMFEGFKERARATREILEAPDTRFLVVSSPDVQGSQNAKAFCHRLQERKIHVGGVILNRALQSALGETGPLLEEIEPAVVSAGGDRALAQRMLEITLHTRATAAIHLAQTESLREALKGIPVAMVPQLRQDVHDLEGLDRLTRSMFG